MMSRGIWVLSLCFCACGAQNETQSANPAGTPSANDPPPANSSLNAPAESATAPSVTPSGAAKPTATPPSPSSAASSPSAHTPSTDPTASDSNDTNQPPSDGGGLLPSASPSLDAGPSNSQEPPVVAPTGPLLEAELAPVPLPRSEHGVGALNGEVYVLGGFTPTVTSSVQVYTPETDLWRDAEDFPVVFHHPNVASVAGVLYVLGFHAGSGQRMADGSVFAYEPESNSWSPRAPQPAGAERGASCVTTFEDKIYLFGGTNDVALPYASVYDPATDSWERLPDMPIDRHHCIAAVVNDKIYLVSGRDVVIEEVQPESYVFDPVTLEYDPVAPILTPRGGAAGGALHGLIYVFGGEGNVDDPKGVFHEAEVYDPAADSWASLPDMTVARHGLGAAVIGDRMYLPGGSTRQGIESSTTHTVFYFEAP